MGVDGSCRKRQPRSHGHKSAGLHLYLFRKASAAVEGTRSIMHDAMTAASSPVRCAHASPTPAASAASLISSTARCSRPVDPRQTYIYIPGKATRKRACTYRKTTFLWLFVEHVCIPQPRD